MTTTDTTLAEISKLVLSLPKVEGGIIQEIHSIEVTRVARVPSSDSWQERRQIRSSYRCFVRTAEDDPKGGKVHADRTGPDLLKVIRETLAAVKIEMPSL